MENISPAIPCGDITAIATGIMDRLVHHFPVCMASDEFHFFPQARADHPDWSKWDDFSPESIAEITSCAANWQKMLALCRALDPDPATGIDTQLLQRVLQTLVEQLTMVSPQHTQPTFYLTIMGIGLSEALDHGPQAWIARLQGLPDFIHQARKNLAEVPQIFGRMGLEMLPKQIVWLKALAPPRNLLQPVLDALSQLETYLRAFPVIEAYLPDVALYEHIAYTHMGCGLNPDATAEAMDREIDETLEILTRESERLEPGQPWQIIVNRLPRPKATAGGVSDIYRQAIDQLSRSLSESASDETRDAAQVISIGGFVGGSTHFSGAVKPFAVVQIRTKRAS